MLGETIKLKYLSKWTSFLLFSFTPSVLPAQERPGLRARSRDDCLCSESQEAKQLCRVEGTEGWDHPAAAPSLPPHLFIPSPIHPAAAVLCPSLSRSLHHTKFPSLSVCPGDTKMDGEAPGMGRTIACATR